MSKVHSAFAQIVNRVESFSKQKQLSTIKEHALAQSIFTEIREENVATQKKAAIEARMKTMSPNNPQNEEGKEDGGAEAGDEDAA